MAKLKAQKREKLGTRSARRLRQDGLVPGIVYGHGQETIPITLSEHDLELAILHGQRVLELQIGRKKENVLVKEVQYDTYGQHALHVDLARVSLDERVEVTLPIVLRGTPDEGGVVQQNISDVTIRCVVTEIPEQIRASVSGMKVGDVMHLSDLPLPQGAELADEPEGIVCSIVMVAEEEPLAAEQPETAEPEVVGEKPQEESEQDEKS